MAFGLSPEGGSTHSLHATRPTESPLGNALRVQRGLAASQWGFFLRAETMHGWYSYLEDNPGKRDPRFHELSHGESFLAVLETRFDGRRALLPRRARGGAVVLLHARPDRRAATGGGREGQVLCATHSPVLASMPGARILEVGDWGLRETTWDDLELVAHWKRFLGAPQAYLRHLTDD